MHIIMIGNTIYFEENDYVPKNDEKKNLVLKRLNTFP